MDANARAGAVEILARSWLPRLDELTGGWQNGDLIVIGGRPSMGKTALASQFALHAALHPRVPVIYLSLDLSSENLALRLTARVSGVHLQRLRAAQLDAEDWKRVEVAAQKLADAPLYLDDTAQAIGDLCARLRDTANKHRIGLAIIDVLQAISPQQASDRDAKPCQNSTVLKSLARELRVPIIMLSQLNRRAERRSPPYPILSDLRGSGATENDADLVLLLYREDVYHARRPGKARQISPSSSTATDHREQYGPAFIPKRVCSRRSDERSARSTLHGLVLSRAHTRRPKCVMHRTC